MKLYYAPGSCSLAVHIALREAGVSFDLVRVEGRGGPKTAGGEPYLSITPKNYVPALRLDSGEVLTECAALLPYVADLAPDKRLAPPVGTMERFRLHEWLAYISSELHKSFGAFFMPGSTDEHKAAGRVALAKKLDLLVSMLAGRDFLLGKNFSVADVYLATVLGWAPMVGVELAPWPALQTYLERIRARPAVQAARAAEGLK